jgi:hypothetical protein
MDKKLEILNKYIDFSKDGVIEREDALKAMQEYADLQLQQTGVSCSFYEIKIDKADSEIINEKLFEPKIQKFLDSTSVCCYLNFPKNWANWELPKRLHKKDLKIISFDKTKILVGW